MKMAWFYCNMIGIKHVKLICPENNIIYIYMRMRINCNWLNACINIQSILWEKNKYKKNSFNYNFAYIYIYINH